MWSLKTKKNIKEEKEQNYKHLQLGLQVVPKLNKSVSTLLRLNKKLYLPPIASLLGEEAIASPSIGSTLWRVSKMFMRPATTPPEVNGFGRNLGHYEYIVGSWP